MMPRQTRHTLVVAGDVGWCVDGDEDDGVEEMMELFQRVPLKNVSSQVNSKVGNSTVPRDSHNQNGLHGHSNSFVQVVKMGHQSNTVVEDQKPALVLDDSCNLDMTSLSVVGNIKEFVSLPNIKNILAAEGFDDIDIRCIGGFWVLFQFVANIQKDKFLAHVGVGSWFTKLQHASINFILDETVTWIDIESVPLCVWSHNTFVRIASKWGSLLNDEDEEAPFFHRKRLWWTPDFNECEDDFTDSDNESSGVNNEETKNKAISDVDSEVEEIPETIFEWKGDVIVMGDFNDVRSQEERFCSIFNAQGAAAITPRLCENTRRNIMDIITTQWSQQ
ncbi:hypothetical protein Tco_1024454 [Tanacetum coccineum]